jgi:5'-nucleotidase
MDPANKSYYWLTGKFQLLDEGDDNDISLLEKGYATVTPIQYDLTAYRLLRDVSSIEL